MGGCWLRLRAVAVVEEEEEEEEDIIQGFWGLKTGSFSLSFFFFWSIPTPLRKIYAVKSHLFGEGERKSRLLERGKKVKMQWYSLYARCLLKLSILFAPVEKCVACFLVGGEWERERGVSFEVTPSSSSSPTLPPLPSPEPDIKKFEFSVAPGWSGHFATGGAA